MVGFIGGPKDRLSQDPIDFSSVWTLREQLDAISQDKWSGLPYGGAWLWGFNSGGQLGQDDVVDRSSPVVVGNERSWQDVSSSQAHTLALTNAGSLWSWGSNAGGQLGHDDQINRSSPVQVGALADWAQVSAGQNASAAVKTNGTLWTWGVNSQGHLGHNDRISRSSPVQVGALTNWSYVTINSDTFGHTTAIKTDGTLWTFGTSRHGIMGTNNLVYRSSPVQVGSLTDWARIAKSYALHMVAVKTDGTIWAWGRNNFGALGINNQISRSSPVQIGALTNWYSAANAEFFTLALKTDGTLWSWGVNSSGQLGHDDRINRSSPVQVGSLTDWEDVAAQEGISAQGVSFALKTDRTLWSWGLNSSGQLGHNDVTNRSSPVQVGTLNRWLKVSSSSGIRRV